MIGLKKRIVVSVTGFNKKQLISKIDEIQEHRIKRFALFITRLKKARDRKEVYKYLLSKRIRKIPLIHIRDDMPRAEVLFLIKNFKPKYLTIHEKGFEYLKKWQGFHKKLFLELNYDNFVPKNVKVRRIGGFCIDLAHFKAGEKNFTKDVRYVLKRRKIKKYFKCNHLGGFSYKRNKDLHMIKSLKEFSYLTTLPRFLFGKCIAIEIDNPISQQLRFKEYLIELLK